MNEELEKDYSTINPIIAFLGVILFLPFSIAMIMGVFSELVKTKSVFEWIYYIIFIYFVGIIPLQISFLLLKLIFTSKGKTIIIKDPPKFFYFLKYYLLLLPVFIGVMVFSLFFLTSFVRQFFKEGLPSSPWALFILTTLTISLWKIVQFSYKWIVGLTKIFISFIRNKRIRR